MQAEGAQNEHSSVIAAPRPKAVELTRTLAIPKHMIGLVGSGGLLLLALAAMARGASLRTWPDAIRTPTPITGIYGENVVGMARFGITVTALFFAFGAALWFSRRCQSRPAVAVALLLPLVFSAPLWIMYPAGSQDMLHNTFDAVLLWQFRESPLVTPPMAHADHPLFSSLSVWEDEASYYGPLWYLAIAPTNAIAGNDLVANLLAQKALVGAFFLGTMVMIYIIARRFQPEAAVAAVVFFAWNPLVLFETVGNGHNDILMIFFGMVGFWCAISRRWFWLVVALAVSICFKYVYISLAPIILIYALAVEGPKVLRPLILGSLAGLAVIIASFAPFYHGPETFTSIFGGLQRWISSPSSLLNTAMTYAIQDEIVAGTWTKRATLGLFGLVYLYLAWRQGSSFSRLITTSFYVIFFYHTIIGWWYWPWYLLWLLPFAALLVGRSEAIIAFILSYTSLLGYIPVGWERFLFDPAFKFIGVEVGRTFFIWSAPIIYWATIPLQRMRFTQSEPEPEPVPIS